MINQIEFLIYPPLLLGLAALLVLTNPIHNIRVPARLYGPAVLTYLAYTAYYVGDDLRQ